MLGYRIEALSEDHNDAEERMIPVLTNRMLVTETLPMFIGGNESKTFTLDRLLDQKQGSHTLMNHRFTLEFVSNPAWYAIQALPYLSEPNNESIGNMFYRLYANMLSAFIIEQNPEIKTIFNSWKSLTPDAFYSQLMKNTELKNTVLQATPWVLDAEDETEQKRRIALLFDMNRNAGEKNAAFEKLKKTQLSNGAWPWFKGMRDDRQITQRIVSGFSNLIQRKVILLDEEKEVRRMLNRAIKYLDDRILEDYEKLKKENNANLNEDHLGSHQVAYLNARTILLEQFPLPAAQQEVYDFYLAQAKKYWLKKNNYLQSMIALTLYRSGNRNEAEGIMRSLKERALFSEELGMYWRQERGWFWYQAPIETQAKIIEVFNTIGNDRKAVEQMKIWLIKQKQTSRWPTASSTAEAVYALLFSGDRLLSNDQPVTINVGGKPVDRSDSDVITTEPGTGYFKTSWSGSDVQPEMGQIEVENPNRGIAWGAAYWQYFEDMDKITRASSPLSISKKIFVEILNEEGKVIKPLQEGQSLKSGDKVVVQLVIRSDRDMDYVHLKDMRATALEPMEQISGYTYSSGLWFYRNITDVSTEFFIRTLQKGTYVLEYKLKVTQTGTFSNGISTIQSFYAPEFAAHSEGIRLKVE
jgi:uncharacterized protein YfaS (alpha-2-macroglobulin family)